MSVFSRIGYFLKIFWLLLGVLALLVLAADALLKKYYPSEPWLKPQVASNPARAAPARENAAANAAEDLPYWREHREAREVRWQSQVYFRREAFRGNAINIDGHGFRVTPQHRSALSLKPAQTEQIDQTGQTIWVFGASTVWGTGVLDRNTVPALLAAEHRTVLNFAELGYVSTQSQLAFMQALRCGARPTAAIFIDGVNDVYSALQAGRAGLPQNEANRALEFNLASDVKRWPNLLRGFAAWRARAQRSSPRLDAAELGAQIAKHYLATVEQSAALAQAAGVDAWFIWQPSVFDKLPLSEEEQAIVDHSPASHRALQLAATAALKTQLELALASNRAFAQRVQIFDQLFAGETRSVYFDYSHTGQMGNKKMADALARLLANDAGVSARSSAERIGQQKAAGCEALPLE